MRVVDQYGVPVWDSGAFYGQSGGGKIAWADDRTFLLGNSAAGGSRTIRGEHISGTAGPAGPFVEFTGLARYYPQIASAGVVNAATNQPGIAAGRTSRSTGRTSRMRQVEGTPFLPVTLSGTAVSVDADGISLPGKLHFISPRQVNAQIPWEFAGKESVKVKVWSDYFASNVITVPLAQYAPGFFEVNGLVAAQNGYLT
jgi:hypothetical protein